MDRSKLNLVDCFEDSLQVSQSYKMKCLIVRKWIDRYLLLNLKIMTIDIVLTIGIC